MSASPRSRRRALVLRTAPRIAVVLALGVLAGTDSRRPDLLESLGLVRPDRAVLPRLSLETAYRACDAPPVDGAIPRADCPAPLSRPSRSFLRLAARVSGLARHSADPEVLHATGLLGLVQGAGVGNGMDATIYYLREAARLSPAPAAALGDVAAAYVVRAGHDQRPRDLVEAVEAAEKALRADPAQLGARYTLATALDHLGLDAEAAAEWRAYLARDSTSRWAREARGRLRPLGAAGGRPRLPGAGAPDSALVEFVRREPQEAERAGLEDLLGDWGDAALAGNEGRARERLRRAEVVGTALEGRGADASLAEAVRAIRRAEDDRAVLLRLARAHRAYAAAQRAYADNDDPAQARWAAAAVRDAGPSPALERWARVSLAVARIGLGRHAEAQGTFRGLLPVVDTARYPALGGRVRWGVGYEALRRGDYPAGEAWVQAAERLYARAGQRENQGMMWLMVAYAREGLGDQPAAYQAFYRSLTALRPYRGSDWRHNLLRRMATRAANDGYPATALRMAGEDVDATGHGGDPELQAEARLRRAGLRLAVGDTAGVRDDAAAADRLAASAGRTAFLDGLFRLVEARRLRDRDPARAAVQLGPVIDAPDPAHDILLPALVARAQALLAAGRAKEADADLHRALDVLDAQRSTVGSAFLRWSLMEASRPVVDRAVMLALADGRVEHALRDLDRARAALAPVGQGPSVPAGDGFGLPAGAVALVYAQVGDTLAAWTVNAGRVRVTRTIVPAAWLGQTVEQARAALERGDGGGALAPLAALHDRLVRPVRPFLGDGQAPLVVVADGVLGAVPFAALWDRVRGRYLVEDHVLRFSGSLREAARGPPGPAEGAAGKLLVLPATDARVFPDLLPLAQAGEEVAQLARLWPGAARLTGQEADHARVRAAMGRAEVIHFAGHAAFDEERPELSYLALAGRDSARMTAAEIERMQLPGVRLVVLSACETVRGGRRSGALAGLSGAFLAAGARGVVGSLWRVDDRRTRELMVAFHRAYAATGDGARALRQAQLDLLRSPDAGLRSPAAWAGFRYGGD